MSKMEAIQDAIDELERQIETVEALFAELPANLIPSEGLFYFSLGVPAASEP